MENQNIKYLLSGEVREILNKPPARATRIVFLITSCIFLLLLFAAFTFGFPDIVDGDLVLTTEQPPIIVDSPRTGILSTVKVKEGDLVSKNELIAIFETDADVDDILELENDLDQLFTMDVDAIRAFIPNRNLELDQQLNVQYEDFISSLEFVPLSGGNPIDQEAVNSVRSEIKQIEYSNNRLKDAINSANAEIKSIEELLNNTRDVYEKNPSQEQLSNKLFSYAAQIKNLESEIAQYRSEIEKNNERIKNKNSQILQMRSSQESGTEERIYELRKNINSLRKSIGNWKENNLVYAPADGKVSFYANLELKNRFKKGEELVAIIPISEQTQYIGLVNIPVEGSGRVKEGQEVNLKFHRYPYIEFGAVKGTVTKIYPLAKGDAYTVDVALDNGLITNQGRALDYFQQMEGEAEIITEERLFVSRLFDKFLENFRKKN
ncbi:MAG: HlyD family efflux transporter periplasmic adaptor subunit [Bacteroidota bacterium]